MEKLPYLKDHQLTNVPLKVRIVKRVGQYPEKDFNTGAPTGRMQTLYNFALPDETIVRHYAKEREEETLALFAAGESVQVVRQEANKDGRRITFNVWSPVDGAEARQAANPPLQSNTRQTATQREMKEHKEEQEEKSIAISLQGFMQQIIPALIETWADDLGNFEHHKIINEALEIAVKAREACLKKAKEIHHGISLPQPSTSIDEVNKVFGSDPSPQL